MRAIQAAAFALSLAAASAAAQAQIYRCGDSYGQQPCAGGKTIEPPDQAPTPAERRQATAATQRDARLADSMERDRVQREAQPASHYIPPPKLQEAPPSARKSPEKAATRKLDVFTASAPASKTPQDKQKNKGKGKSKGSAGAQQRAQPASGTGTLAVSR